MENLSPHLASLVPGGLGAKVRLCEIDAQGNLRVQVTLHDAHGAPVTALSGRRLDLSLFYAGETWPMEATVVADDQADWLLLGFGTGLGLPPGDFPPLYFRLFLVEGTNESA